MSDSAYLPGLTALLGEQVRSQLAGYRVILQPHPTLAASVDGDAREGVLNGRARVSPARAVVVPISAPQLEVVCWVRESDELAEPWTRRAVEVRAVVHAAEFGEEQVIAAMVGDTVGFDEALPLGEVFDCMRTLIEDDLPLETEDLPPAAQTSLVEAMRVYHNDPIRPGLL